MTIDLTICIDTEDEDDIELVAECDYQPEEKAVYWPNELAHPGCPETVELCALWRFVGRKKFDVTHEFERYITDDILYAALEDQDPNEPDPDYLRDQQLDRE